MLFTRLILLDAGSLSSKRTDLNPAHLNYFINPAYVASLLYCLIVVPKEVWVLGESHAIYDRIDKTWLLGLFDIEKSERRFGDGPVFSLLRHLRNAVSHANFSVAADGRFTFWDQKGKAADPYFRASVSLASLQEFLSKVGALFANLRTSQKNDR